MSVSKRAAHGGVLVTAVALLGLWGCDDGSASQAAGAELASSGSALQQRAVAAEKELVIVDRSVVESPLETTFDPRHPDGAAPQGAWSFGRLVHNLLPRGQRGDARAASRFTVQWL